MQDINQPETSRSRSTHRHQNNLETYQQSIEQFTKSGLKILEEGKIEEAIHLFEKQSRLIYNQRTEFQSYEMNGEYEWYKLLMMCKVNISVALKMNQEIGQSLSVLLDVYNLISNVKIDYIFIEQYFMQDFKSSYDILLFQICEAFICLNQIDNYEKFALKCIFYLENIFTELLEKVNGYMMLEKNNGQNQSEKTSNNNIFLSSNLASLNENFNQNSMYINLKHKKTTQIKEIEQLFEKKIIILQKVCEYLGNLYLRKPKLKEAAIAFKKSLSLAQHAKNNVEIERYQKIISDIEKDQLESKNKMKSLVSNNMIMQSIILQNDCSITSIEDHKENNFIKLEQSFSQNSSPIIRRGVDQIGKELSKNILKLDSFNQQKDQTSRLDNSIDLKQQESKLTKNKTHNLDENVEKNQHLEAFHLINDNVNKQNINNLEEQKKNSDGDEIFKNQNINQDRLSQQVLNDNKNQNMTFSQQKFNNILSPINSQAQNSNSRCTFQNLLHNSNNDIRSVRKSSITITPQQNNEIFFSNNQQPIIVIKQQRPSSVVFQDKKQNLNQQSQDFSKGKRQTFHNESSRIKSLSQSKDINRPSSSIKSSFVNNLFCDPRFIKKIQQSSKEKYENQIQQEFIMIKSKSQSKIPSINYQNQNQIIKNYLKTETNESEKITNYDSTERLKTLKTQQNYDKYNSQLNNKLYNLQSPTNNFLRKSSSQVKNQNAFMKNKNQFSFQVLGARDIKSESENKIKNRQNNKINQKKQNSQQIQITVFDTTSIINDTASNSKTVYPTRYNTLLHHQRVESSVFQKNQICKNEIQFIQPRENEKIQSSRNQNSQEQQREQKTDFTKLLLDTDLINQETSVQSYQKLKSEDNEKQQQNFLQIKNQSKNQNAESNELQQEKFQIQREKSQKSYIDDEFFIQNDIQNNQQKPQKLNSTNQKNYLSENTIGEDAFLKQNDLFQKTIYNDEIEKLKINNKSLNPKDYCNVKTVETIPKNNLLQKQQSQTRIQLEKQHSGKDVTRLQTSSANSSPTSSLIKMAHNFMLSSLNSSNLPNEKLITEDRIIGDDIHSQIKLEKQESIQIDKSLEVIRVKQNSMQVRTSSKSFQEGQIKAQLEKYKKLRQVDENISNKKQEQKNQKTSLKNLACQLMDMKGMIPSTTHQNQSTNQLFSLKVQQDNVLLKRPRSQNRNNNQIQAQIIEINSKQINTKSQDQNKQQEQQQHSDQVEIRRKARKSSIFRIQWEIEQQHDNQKEEYQNLNIRSKSKSMGKKKSIIVTDQNNQIALNLSRKSIISSKTQNDDQILKLQTQEQSSLKQSIIPKSQNISQNLNQKLGNSISDSKRLLWRSMTRQIMNDQNTLTQKKKDSQFQNQKVEVNSPQFKHGFQYSFCNQATGNLNDHSQMQISQYQFDRKSSADSDKKSQNKIEEQDQISQQYIPQLKQKIGSVSNFVNNKLQKNYQNSSLLSPCIKNYQKKNTMLSSQSSHRSVQKKQTEDDHSTSLQIIQTKSYKENSNNVDLFDEVNKFIIYDRAARIIQTFVKIKLLSKNQLKQSIFRKNKRQNTQTGIMKFKISDLNKATSNQLLISVSQKSQIDNSNKISNGFRQVESNQSLDQNSSQDIELQEKQINSNNTFQNSERFYQNSPKLLASQSQNAKNILSSERVFQKDNFIQLVQKLPFIPISFYRPLKFEHLSLWKLKELHQNIRLCLLVPQIKLIGETLVLCTNQDYIDKIQITKQNLQIFKLYKIARYQQRRKVVCSQTPQYVKKSYTATAAFQYKNASTYEELSYLPKIKGIQRKQSLFFQKDLEQKEKQSYLEFQQFHNSQNAKQTLLIDKESEHSPTVTINNMQSSMNSKASLSLHALSRKEMISLNMESQQSKKRDTNKTEKLKNKVDSPQKAISSFTLKKTDSQVINSQQQQSQNEKDADQYKKKNNSIQNDQNFDFIRIKSASLFNKFQSKTEQNSKSISYLSFNPNYNMSSQSYLIKQNNKLDLIEQKNDINAQILTKDFNNNSSQNLNIKEQIHSEQSEKYQINSQHIPALSNQSQSDKQTNSILLSKVFENQLDFENQTQKQPTKEIEEQQDQIDTLTKYGEDSINLSKPLLSSGNSFNIFKNAQKNQMRQKKQDWKEYFEDYVVNGDYQQVRYNQIKSTANPFLNNQILFKGILKYQKNYLLCQIIYNYDEYFMGKYFTKMIANNNSRFIIKFNEIIRKRNNNWQSQLVLSFKTFIRWFLNNNIKNFQYQNFRDCFGFNKSQLDQIRKNVKRLIYFEQSEAKILYFQQNIYEQTLDKKKEKYLQNKNVNYTSIQSMMYAVAFDNSLQDLMSIINIKNPEEDIKANLNIMKSSTFMQEKRNMRLNKRIQQIKQNSNIEYHLKLINSKKKMKNHAEKKVTVVKEQFEQAYREYHLRYQEHQFDSQLMNSKYFQILRGYNTLYTQQGNKYIYLETQDCYFKFKKFELILSEKLDILQEERLVMFATFKNIQKQNKKYIMTFKHPYIIDKILNSILFKSEFNDFQHKYIQNFLMQKLFQKTREINGIQQKVLSFYKKSLPQDSQPSTFIEIFNQKTVELLTSFTYVNRLQIDFNAKETQEGLKLLSNHLNLMLINQHINSVSENIKKVYFETIQTQFFFKIQNQKYIVESTLFHSRNNLNIMPIFYILLKISYFKKQKTVSYKLLLSQGDIEVIFKSQVNHDNIFSANQLLQISLTIMKKVQKIPYEHYSKFILPLKSFYPFNNYLKRLILINSFSEEKNFQMGSKFSLSPLSAMKVEMNYMKVIYKGVSKIQGQFCILTIKQYQYLDYYQIQIYFPISARKYSTFIYEQNIRQFTIEFIYKILKYPSEINSLQYKNYKEFEEAINENQLSQSFNQEEGGEIDPRLFCQLVNPALQKDNQMLYYMWNQIAQQIKVKKNLQNIQIFQMDNYYSVLHEQIFDRVIRVHNNDSILFEVFLENLNKKNSNKISDPFKNIHYSNTGEYVLFIKINFFNKVNQYNEKINLQNTLYTYYTENLNILLEDLKLLHKKNKSKLQYKIQNQQDTSESQNVTGNHNDEPILEKEKDTYYIKYQGNHQNLKDKYSIDEILNSLEITQSKIFDAITYISEKIQSNYQILFMQDHMQFSQKKQSNQMIHSLISKSISYNSISKITPHNKPVNLIVRNKPSFLQENENFLNEIPNMNNSIFTPVSLNINSQQQIYHNQHQVNTPVSQKDVLLKTLNLNLNSYLNQNLKDNSLVIDDKYSPINYNPKEKNLTKQQENQISIPLVFTLNQADNEQNYQNILTQKQKDNSNQPYYAASVNNTSFLSNKQINQSGDDFSQNLITFQQNQKTAGGIHSKYKTRNPQIKNIQESNQIYQQNNSQPKNDQLAFDNQNHENKDNIQIYSNNLKVIETNLIKRDKRQKPRIKTNSNLNMGIVENSLAKNYIILYRKLLTFKPQIFLSIIFNEKYQKIIFSTQNLENCQEFNKSYDLYQIEYLIPYASKMIENSLFKEVGERLYLAYKNRIIVSLNTSQL
ncbi:hypothetical protein TTHERM_000780669 (macronuclear) [Tetrahymena thermophila SB210]|uniref:Uncharacterized protein n=1 Tax=Tetrahymena thermophila (strain SB210) TaxID=312017 RepID=W7X4T8_TETTS|nr:hypothetical protein TTHERM_000780669 [Tetrahymena thermophila SB210]EWS71383.1 hypothetical protein TTHERM_000780669 [Tetrahymena thermophila SB210]|eukprot:XP_012656084.1 hypothetical protein TTHERM_000780669 [Tetrahymena thermophila SB210]